MQHLCDRPQRFVGWVRPGLVIAATIVAIALIVGCASVGQNPAPPLRGFGAGVAAGPHVEGQLSALAVSWYTDWSHNGASAPGRQRLYVIKGWLPARDAAAAVRARRGSWWAIGNEPNDPNQDNQTPAEYAAFFRDVVTAIRAADPSARIMSAGIANSDWRWAQQFRDEYRQLTGSYPVVDAWNIHSYMLEDHEDQYDTGEFKRRITAFRAWMNEIGDGDKPLVLSEYGILYGAGCCERPLDPPQLGVDFMVETTTWLARGDLVQAWAWFMANSGDQQFNGDLFDATGKLTAFGEAYRQMGEAAR